MDVETTLWAYWDGELANDQPSFPAKSVLKSLLFNRPRNPLCWLDPGAFGTLGVGGGFALGAKLARPNAEVWIVWGDGSSAYSIAEYDTFKRFKVS